MLQDCDVSKHKSNIFIAANEKTIGSEILFQAWMSLYWPTVMLNQFMLDFLMSTIQPYIPVKWNQLRKYLIDIGRDDIPTRLNNDTLTATVNLYITSCISTEEIK